MSGRPPPPLPPSASAATRTRSTAETRAVRSSVTPAATAALSPVSATSRMTPDSSRALCSSIRPRRSLPETPARLWARNGMPATVSGPFASAGPPASARRRRSSAISFACDAALVEQGADALGQLVGAGAQQRRGFAERLRLGGDVGERALAGQRLDAADAARGRGLGDELEGADVAGAARRGCRRRARASRCRRRRRAPSPGGRPSRRRGPRRRTSRRRARGRRDPRRRPGS